MTPESSRYFWAGRSVFDTQSTLAETGAPRMFGSDQIDLNMLLERCSTDSPCGQVALPGGVTLFMPENYEPNYAYPLIVWISGRGSSSQDLLSLMPRISCRNLFGVCLPESSSLDEDVSDTVYQIRREYHLHSERVYLAALGRQAACGLDTLLRRPDWFGGLICLGGVFFEPQLPPLNFHDLHGRRVLLGMHTGVDQSSISETIRIARLLHSARMEVATRVYGTGDEITPRMLADIHHWLMDGIRESNLVY